MRGLRGRDLRLACLLAIDLPMSRLSMKGAKGDLMERVGVLFQWV